MSDDETQIAEEMSPESDDELDVDPETGEILSEPEQEDAQPEAAAAPRSQKEIDTMHRKLAAAAESYAKRVEGIMGDDFALLVPSPVDWVPGYIFNVPEMHPLPEQVAALHALLGGAAPPELRDAEDAEGCDKCNALGEVLTGSRKPGQETKPCTACTGTGWRTRPVPMQPPAVVTNIEHYTNGAGNQPNQFQVADRWGRPFGHPHYNMEPASVG